MTAAQPVASIDVWPGAGGGMLVSLSLPSVGGPFPRHWDLPNCFMRICPWGKHRLLAPYIGLGDRAKWWLRDIIGDELAMSAASISVVDKSGDASPDETPIPMALFRAEWQLRAMASICKDLLLAEAAETWRVEESCCVLCDGFVLYDGGVRFLSMSSLASGASMQRLRTQTELRCGRRIRVESRRASFLRAVVSKD